MSDETFVALFGFLLAIVAVLMIGKFLFDYGSFLPF